MKVQILGSGDAFGSGGRFNTCLHLTPETGAPMLIDCGSSSMIALAKAGIDLNEIETILFTHFHGDHFGGLPFFVLSSQFLSGRKQPLLIMGPKGVEERARVAMEAAFPGSSTARRAFETRFLEIAPESPMILNNLHIAAFAMVHDERAGPCQGYRLTEATKTLAFSGDTAWCESLLPLADNADVLLIECYTVDRQLPNHLDWQTLSRRRSELRAKRIVLTHMGPDMLAHDSPLPVERAADGMVIVL